MCRAAVGYGLSKMLAKGRMKFRACDTGFVNHWKVTMSKSKPQELMSWAQQSVLTKQGQRATLWQCCLLFCVNSCRQLTVRHLATDCNFLDVLCPPAMPKKLGCYQTPVLNSSSLSRRLKKTDMRERSCTLFVLVKNSRCWSVVSSSRFYSVYFLTFELIGVAGYISMKGRLAS